MTRKRFIKLLMSHGTQRNEAQARADYVVCRGISYKQAYPMARLSATMANLSKPIQAAIIGMSKLAVVMAGFARASEEEMKRKLNIHSPSAHAIGNAYCCKRSDSNGKLPQHKKRYCRNSRE